MKKIRRIDSSINNEDKRLKVCAYCRVSTEQEEQKNSFSAQVEYYSSYIKNNPAWEFAGIYSDNGISAKNKEKRDDFMRMIRDAENRRIDLIVTKSVYRFARNQVDCLETVRRLKEIGVAVYFEKENINTLNAESELVLSIISSIAEEELVSHSYNVRWGHRRGFQKGKVMINTKRFLGYDKDMNGNLIINEEQAGIVRRIFNDYLSGLGMHCIAKNLEADGVKNISGNVRWGSSSIAVILKNEKYMGEVLLQKTFTTNFKKKKNRGELPIYYMKENHEAIIEKDIFEKVQGLMEARAKLKGNREGEREKYQNRHIFAGNILCGNCGRTYKRHIDNCGNMSEVVCWICNSYIKGGASSCSIGRVKEETIKELFVRVFNRLYTERDKILGSYRKKLESGNFTEFDNGRIECLDTEIQMLLKQEHVLFTIREKGYANEEIFKAEHDELVAKLTKLQTERFELVSALTFQDNRIKQTVEINALLETQEGTIEKFRDELYNAIIEKIVVKERTCLVFYLKNGLALEERYILRRGKDEI